MADIFNKENEKKLEQNYLFWKEQWFKTAKKTFGFIVPLLISSVFFGLAVQGYFMVYAYLGFEKTIIVILAAFTVIFGRVMVENAYRKNQ